MFATITAIAGLVGWADLGIGNGVVSEVAAAEGRGDRASIGRVVSTAFFALLGLSLVLGVLFAAVYPFVPWDSIFNVSGDAAGGVGEAAAAFALGVLLALPLGVVQRAEIGMQETFVASAWQALGSLLTLVGVILAAVAGASLPYFVLAVSVTPAVALAGNGVDLFFGRRAWLRPSLRLVDRSTARLLLRVGWIFFVIQVSMAIAYESDALVLTQILGPSAVTVYSVTMRVFLVVPALAGFVLAPLWPAYGEAISRGDAEWVTPRTSPCVARWTRAQHLRGGAPRSDRSAVHPCVGWSAPTVFAGPRSGDLDRRPKHRIHPLGIPQWCSRDPLADGAGGPDDGVKLRTLDRVHPLDWDLRCDLGLNCCRVGSCRDHRGGRRSARSPSSRPRRASALGEMTSLAKM